VNLIGKPSASWVKHLVNEFHHSMSDDGKKFFSETVTWLESLLSNLKGDTWEVEIMSHAINEVCNRVKDTQVPFMTQAK
jgi:hypothetical protein